MDAAPARADEEQRDDLRRRFRAARVAAGLDGGGDRGTGTGYLRGLVA